MANTFAGFTAQDLNAHFGSAFGVPAIQALIDAYNGMPLTPADQQAINALSPGQLQSLQANAANPATGMPHLNEHPKDSHYHGDYNPLRDTLAPYIQMSTAGMLSYEGDNGNIFNTNNWRANVPFTSAQTGAWEKGIGNFYTGGQFRGDIDKAVDSPIGRGVNTGIAMGEGALVGAGVGSALGAGAGTGALVGAGAQQLGSQAGAQFGPQQEGLSGGAGGQTTGPGGLTAQQLASLSAMNSQAHRGLAPSFEAKMRGQSPGVGIAGDPFQQFNQM